MNVAERFGENLMIHRRRAGLSQEQLGFLASLHRTEIGMLERGVRLARIDTLVKLTGALEVTPGELLAGLGWSPGGPRIGSFGIDEGEEAER
jgi:transcriptional regulator with XRE-family HTH domain